ncbi:hypothetical protein [Emticicia sp. BO119]|uniref:hypothetical protein n=1 Tax=Emticicia sp. BO119 TaxID=2757768 RepID=UPI0015F022BE|nr:hypothetical protein [Emticicia sp. BO119]MBA4850455.1 hypothetical protein [Emticicia sp. BO119]
MENLDFEYNFAALDLVRLFHEDKITKEEIIYVFENPKRHREEGGPNLENSVFIDIEYTFKKRILLVAYTFISTTIDFIGAKVADEEDIDNFYCIG